MKNGRARRKKKMLFKFLPQKLFFLFQCKRIYWSQALFKGNCAWMEFFHAWKWVNNLFSAPSLYVSSKERKKVTWKVHFWLSRFCNDEMTRQKITCGIFMNCWNYLKQLSDAFIRRTNVDKQFPYCLCIISCSLRFLLSHLIHDFNCMNNLFV